MNTLPDLIAAGRSHYIATHKRAPDTLAIGRWDARELCRMVKAETHGGSTLKPSQFLRQARGGITAWGVPVKVDGRIGRMPASLWWLP